MSMWDEHGKTMTPDWVLTGPKVCGGKTTFNKAANSITIEHGVREQEDEQTQRPH